MREAQHMLRSWATANGPEGRLIVRLNQTPGALTPETAAGLIEALQKIDLQTSHGKMGDWQLALTEIRQIAREAIAKATGAV